MAFELKSTSYCYIKASLYILIGLEARLALLMQYGFLEYY